MAEDSRAKNNGAMNSRLENVTNNDLKDKLNDICFGTDNKHVLVQALEGDNVFKENNITDTRMFCNQYFIAMVNKYASKNAYDFILLSCNLLEPYSELQTDIERFERYALDAFDLNKEIRKYWSNIADSMSKKPIKFVNNLARKIHTDIYKDKKRITLGLVEEAKSTKCPAYPKCCRKYYKKDEFENGCLDNRIVLNSIVDLKSRIDERKFMWACVSYSLSNDKWQEAIINPEDGKEYYVLLRIYNDNPRYVADSEEINIEFALREEYAKGIRLDGFIRFGQNSRETCWDFIKFKSDKEFHLEYVDDSAALCYDDPAVFCNKNYKDTGLSLDDNIINHDIKKERGIWISGGELSRFWGDSNSCVIMIKVKTVFTNYIITHKLRNIESGSCDYTINAKPSDEIEFMIAYKDISADSSNKSESGNGGHDISIKEQLADGLEYVVGSTYINDVHEENDIICGDALTINDKSVTITFKARVTAYAIGEYECCVVVDGSRAESTTVIVDDSEERRPPTVNGDNAESGVSCDSENKANDNLAENTLVGAASETTLEKDTAATSDIVNDDEQPKTHCDINSVITADDVSEDVSEDVFQIQTQPIENKNDKKPFRIKSYIFAAAAVMVILAGIAIFLATRAQPNENAVPDDGSDPTNYVTGSNSSDNISDSSSLTSESSNSEETSTSANIPNLEIETPEGLSREINGDGRSPYTTYQIMRGVLENKIVFNSISNSSSIGGDERNFVAAREDTANTSDAANEWNTSDVVVEDGKEYVIRLYVHNNNPGGLDAVATNTKVAFDIPSYSAKQIQVNGFISADNAEPNIYWGHVNFIADQAFHLKYDYGSALLENEGVGKDGGVKLSDNIITKKTDGGELIGYDDLDGCVPGGYEYHNYVTIRVRAVFDTDYTIDNEVRLVGGADIWDNYVVAEIGDIVEFRISYQNLHKTENQDHVAIKDILPKNLRYVPGTTKLVNAKYPDGTVVSPDGIILSGLSIGSYSPNGNAYVYLRAEVVDDGLACGNNTLTNWAQGSVGVVTIQDYANVVVNKTCDTPELPNTDP